RRRTRAAATSRSCAASHQVRPARRPRDVADECPDLSGGGPRQLCQRLEHDVHIAEAVPDTSDESPAGDLRERGRGDEADADAPNRLLDDLALAHGQAVQYGDHLEDATPIGRHEEAARTSVDGGHQGQWPPPWPRFA